MKKLTLFLTIILATAFSASAQNTECIVTDYFATNGTAGANSNENYDKLLDDNRNTKWYVNNQGNPTFVEFHHGSPFIPTGYILTTGNDNATNNGRNPKNWVIKAKLNPDDDWTTIATVTNDNVLQDVNHTDFEFTINNTNQYKYFRFEVWAVQSGSKFQLGEFRFKGEGVMNTDPIIAGFTAYAGHYMYDHSTIHDAVDNNRLTYWHDSNWGNRFSMDFYSDQAFIPTGYILTSPHTFRPFSPNNPVSWRIDAKMNFEDEWETIAQVNDPMPRYTKTDFEYTINNNNNKVYRYFHFEARSAGGNSGGTLRLAELRFRGQVVDGVYIKDLKLIGGTKEQVNDLRESYGEQGWKCIDYDLNKGCGSSSDYIYLLYKDEYSEGHENKGFVSDFYLWTQNANATATRTYNGKNYHLVPYDGGDHFKDVKGDLNSNAGGADIHLYYTKEAFPDLRSVDGIVFNDVKSGALGSGGSSTGYDLNSGAGGAYIYMHFTTSPTTGVMPCGIVDYVVGYGSINISGTAYDADDLSTSVSLRACLYEEDGITLCRQKGCLADLPNNGFALTMNSIPPGVYRLKLFGTDTNGYGEVQIGVSHTVTVAEGPEAIGIGHGDETSLIPMEALVQYKLTQQIYTAGEIQTAGTITGVAFYFKPYSGANTFPMPDVQIYMQHTDKEYFENKDDIVPVDLNCKVFEGTVVAENTCWVVFDFDKPFEYDGVHNILLSFNDPTEYHYPGDWSIYRFKTQSGSHNSRFSFMSESNPIDLANLANHPRESRHCGSERNDIQFYILPSGCPGPANLRLGQCTSDAATVVWDAPETNQGINVYLYQFKRGDGPWISGQTSGRTVSYGNLENGTEYRFRVKTRYNNGDESVFSEIKFKTPRALPYENSFESGYDDMSVFSIDWDHGGIRDENSYSGSKSFTFFNTVSPQYLISPCFPNTDQIAVSFYHKSAASHHNMFQVGYSTSDNGVDSFTWVDVVVDSTRYWSKYWNLYSQTFPLGTRYIAIKYVSGTRGLYIDDFLAEKPSSRGKPENITASDLTTNSATITWTAPKGEIPVGYEFQYMKSSLGIWTADTGFVASNSVTISNREPNTEYDIRVKALYADGESSNFVRYRFMTEALPHVLPIQEGFEGGMGGWRVVNGKNHTEIYPYVDAHTGINVFHFNKESEEDQYLISPEFISDEDLYLSFFYKTYKTGNEHFLASFYVGYSTTTKDLDAFTWSDALTGLGDWQEYKAQYPAGTKYFAVKWSKSVSTKLYVDDFSIWTTMSHSVAGASNWDEPSRPIDGWNFIASPVEGSVTPTSVKNLIYSVDNLPLVYSERYDLYRLNNTTWENYKAHLYDFVLENGKGYLYAIYGGANLEFTGLPYEGSTKTVGLSQGYNLVGNPFYADAYIDRPYYRMNDARTNIVAVMDYINTPIPKCTGVVVTADSGAETVTFTTTPPAAMANNNGSLQITLMKADSRDDAVQDKAIVSFNDDTKLGKFVFNESHSKLYIPQGGEHYSIASATEQEEVPLSFKASRNGSYCLTFDPDATMDYLHLIDNLTGADIDLLATPSYTFEGKTSDYADRFRLVFNANSGNADGDKETFAYFDGSAWVIAASSDATVQVVDMMGRVVRTVGLSQRGSRITTTGMPAGVYVLRLIDGDSVRTQKIVVE